MPAKDEEEKKKDVREERLDSFNKQIFRDQKSQARYRNKTVPMMHVMGKVSSRRLRNTSLL